MLLPIVAAIQHELHTPGPETPDGLTPDGWAAQVAVESHGWYPPSADQVGIEPGRRDVECDLILMVAAGTVCGDKDRWTIPGEGIFVQDGRGGLPETGGGLMSKMRIEWNRPAFAEIRTLPAVMDELNDLAGGVAARAGEGFEARPAEESGGRVRGRAAVVTATTEAMVRQARDHVLESSL